MDFGGVWSLAAKPIINLFKVGNNRIHEPPDGVFRVHDRGGESESGGCLGGNRTDTGDRRSISAAIEILIPDQGEEVRNGG